MKYIQENNNYPLLNYSVIGSSSEDEEHPLFSLISKDKNEGWCSAPFCKYPQEIILQLDNPCRLTQINITSLQKLNFIIFIQHKKNLKKKNLILIIYHL